MTDDSELQSRAKREVPIFLIGFMGAGKSTIGKTLARRLTYKFLDSDAIIESTAGRSISQIFADLGEDEFRRLEREALKSISELTRVVVALGGGAYVAEENRGILRDVGISIWIDCPLDLCWSRVSKETHRPLLKSYSEMAALLQSRRPAYEQADLTVQTGARPPAKVVREIMELLGTG
jgi:shikimate kinase